MEGGNRQSIKMWEDKWIPIANNFTPTVANDGHTVNCMVSDVIDSDTRQWNVTLLTSLFSPRKVEQICSISIAYHGTNHVQQVRFLFSKTLLCYGFLDGVHCERSHSPSDNPKIHGFSIHPFD